MFNGRQDIIGDLSRLRGKFLANGGTADLDELEILAAVAVSHGMSHNIVAKASGVPRGRIDAVLDHSPTVVRDQMAAYHRKPSGVVVPREPPADSGGEHQPGGGPASTSGP